MFDDMFDDVLKDILDIKDDERTEDITQYVAFVLDESGSMESIRQAAIDAYNEQLNVLRKESDGMKTYVSTTRFGGKEGTVIGKPVPLEDVEILTEENYEPHGYTPLYDAMGETVLEVGKRYKTDKSDAAVLIVTVTDGFENASTKFDQRKIKGLVEELENTERWTFTFLAANQNPLETAVADMGMKYGNVMAFNATQAGMSSASSSLSSSTSSYMSQRKMGMRMSDTFYDDSKKEEETDEG